MKILIRKLWFDLQLDSIILSYQLVMYETRWLDTVVTAKWNHGIEVFHTLIIQRFQQRIINQCTWLSLDMPVSLYPSIFLSPTHIIFNLHIFKQMVAKFKSPLSNQWSLSYGRNSTDNQYNPKIPPYVDFDETGCWSIFRNPLAWYINWCDCSLIGKTLSPWRILTTTSHNIFCITLIHLQMRLYNDLKPIESGYET